MDSVGAVPAVVGVSASAIEVGGGAWVVVGVSGATPVEEVGGLALGVGGAGGAMVVVGAAVVAVEVAAAPSFASPLEPPHAAATIAAAAEMAKSRRCTIAGYEVRTG